MALTTAEASAWRVFAAARQAVPATGGRDVIAARTPTQKPAALLWSSSVLFSTFYDVVGGRERQQAPVDPRESSGGADVDLFAAAETKSDCDDLDGDATSSAGSMVDLVAASGSPDGSTAAVDGAAADVTGEIERLSLARSSHAGEAPDAEEAAVAYESTDNKVSTDDEESTDGEESTSAKEATAATESTDSMVPTHSEEATDDEEDANTEGATDAARRGDVARRTLAPRRVHAAKPLKASNRTMILRAGFLGVKRIPPDGPTVAEVAPSPVVKAAYGEQETRAAAGPR